MQECVYIYIKIFSTAHTIAQTDVVHTREHNLFCVPSSESIKMLLKCEIFFLFQSLFS